MKQMILGGLLIILSSPCFARDVIDPFSDTSAENQYQCKNEIISKLKLPIGQPINEEGAEIICNSSRPICVIAAYRFNYPSSLSVSTQLQRYAEWCEIDCMQTLGYVPHRLRFNLCNPNNTLENFRSGRNSDETIFDVVNEPLEK